MSIKLYITKVTTSKEMFNKQNKIRHVLKAKGIQWEEIDLSRDPDVRDQMREKAGIPNLLPPALFNGDTYCGDYDAFEYHVEENTIKDFLKIQ